MKNFILSLIVLFLVSCAATKKGVETMNTSSSVQETNASQQVKMEKVVDTTKTESGKVIITEIDFFPPTLSPDIGISGNDETTIPCFEIDGVGKVKGGNVKSIRQTSIEAMSEIKGQSKDSEEIKDEESKAVVDKTSNAKVVVSSPEPDPYRWRYIFYILAILIAVAIFIYVRRKPLVDKYKTILSQVKKLL